MKQFSLLQTPIMAFFSREFYKDVAKNWNGTGFATMFIILLVLWSVISIRGYFVMNQGLESKDVNDLINQLPTMDLRDGKLSIDKPSPYTIYTKNADGNQTAILTFDTTGNTKTPDEINGCKALATETELIVKKDESDTTPPIAWSGLQKDIHATPADVKSALKSCSLVFLGLFWAFGLVVFVGHMLLALFYGLIGMVMDRNKLGYATCLRMAAIAMTPSIVLSSILSLSGAAVPFWGLITIPISLGYLYFGLASVDTPIAVEPIT